MEGYYAAKARLFRTLEPGAAAVVNIDDPYGRRLAEEIPAGVRTLTYGFSEGADIRAEDVHLTGPGARYRLITPVGEADVEAPHLFGTYNVSNAMAAVGAGLALGFSLQDAAAALARPRARPAGSSASTRGRTSRWWWITPTRRMASRSCSPTWPG